MAHLSVHFAQDEEEQPLYCSPARIVFKPGQLSVQKASYVKRVIVRCIRHLPVPYIIEIPKGGNSRFEVGPAGRADPDDWNMGIIDSGMEGIALSVTYRHPVAGEADYVYDNFQHVVYIHTPEHTLAISIKAIRNDQEDDILPSNLPLPTRPQEKEFPVLRVATAMSPPYRESDNFNDEDFETEFSESLNMDGFATAMPDYPQSPPRDQQSVGQSEMRTENVRAMNQNDEELEYYKSLLNNGNKANVDEGASNSSSGIDKHVKASKDILSNEDGTTEGGAIADNQVPSEEKEGRVENIEDARAMIRSMRMGRSTRITASTLAKTGSSVIAQAGRASFKLNATSSSQTHSADEMNFYKTFLKREKEKQAKLDMRKNKYDVSKNRQRAKLVDERIEKEFPLLAKARRRITTVNGKLGLNDSSVASSKNENSSCRSRASRIIFSSSEDEEEYDHGSNNDVIEDVIGSAVIDESYALPTAGAKMEDEPGRLEKSESITWSSDDDDDDDIRTKQPSVAVDEEERSFYKSLTLGVDFKHDRSSRVRKPISRIKQNRNSNTHSGALDRHLDGIHQEDVDEEDIQRDYAERLRAALSDVTDAKFENKRQTRQNTSSNIPYGRSRFAVKKRKPKKYLRKDEKIVDVRDWL